MTAPGGSSAALRAIVPADYEEFARVYHVNPILGGTFDLSQDGAWVSQAYRAHYGAEVGDTLEILSPRSMGLSFAVERIVGADGLPKEKADLVQEHVRISCPHALAAGDLLRRRLQSR